MRLRNLLGALLLPASLSSCASVHPQGKPISLQNAVTNTIDAMKTAYDRTKGLGGTWGLAPSEVTIVYNVSDESTDGETLNVTAGYASASIGGGLALTQKSVSGNTVTLKFTRK